MGTRPVEYKLEGVATDGRFVIGWSGSQAEYFDFADVATAVLVDGYADISSGIGSKFMRATVPVRFRLSGGTGSGTFRVRITYKA